MDLFPGCQGLMRGDRKYWEKINCWSWFFFGNKQGTDFYFSSLIFKVKDLKSGFNGLVWTDLLPLRRTELAASFSFILSYAKML